MFFGWFSGVFCIFWEVLVLSSAIHFYRCFCIFCVFETNTAVISWKIHHIYCNFVVISLQFLCSFVVIQFKVRCDSIIAQLKFVNYLKNNKPEALKIPMEKNRTYFALDSEIWDVFALDSFYWKKLLKKCSNKNSLSIKSYILCLTNWSQSKQT